MSAQGQAPQTDKKRRNHVQPPVLDPQETVQEAAEVLPELTPAYNGATVKDQAAMLHRLPPAQGHLVAHRIGDAQGNRHLGHVVGALHKSSTPSHAPAPQAKLTVSEPGDAYEQEADQVAEQVMTMTLPPGLATPPPPGDENDDANNRHRPAALNRYLQRAPFTGDDGVGGRPVAPDVESRVARLQHGGKPLPAEERAFFEPRMGVDLSSVRVHTDAPSVQTSRDLNARAFTVGSHIAFNEGAYQPGTTAGRRLLGHELTHVVQQGGAGEIQRASSKVTPTTEFIQKYQLDPTFIESLGNLVANVDNFLSVLDHLGILARFARIASISTALGLVLSILQPFEMLARVAEASVTDLRMLADKAIAFAITAWVFHRDSIMLEPPAEDLYMLEYGWGNKRQYEWTKERVIRAKKTWRESTENAIQAIIWYHSAELHLKARDYKILIRAVVNNDPQKLAESIYEQLGQRYADHHPFTLEARKTLNINYPKLGSGKSTQRTKTSSLQRKPEGVSGTPQDEELPKLQQWAETQIKSDSTASQPIASDMEDSILSLQHGARLAPTSEQVFFKPRTGVTLGNVRAFTVSPHIAFGKSTYRPGSAVGQQFLDHESTPVVQPGEVGISQAIQRGLSALNTTKSTTNKVDLSKGDPRGKLAALHPTLQAKARELLRNAQEKGLDVWIFEGMRTIARQNELYAQGRTTKGKIVTKVKGGDSYHNYGLAIDVVFSGKQPWGEQHDWAALGAAGQAAGLEWGGAWKKFQDRPHFQLPGLKLSQIKKWHVDGGMENVWKHVGAEDGNEKVTKEQGTIPSKTLSSTPKQEEKASETKLPNNTSKNEDKKVEVKPETAAKNEAVTPEKSPKQDTATQVNGGTSEAVAEPHKKTSDTSHQDDADDTQEAATVPPQEMADLAIDDLALIDEELAEHQQWAGAMGNVGEVGSAARAKFIAETAGGGVLQGAGTGFVMGFATGIVGQLAMKFVPIPSVGAVLGGAMSVYGLATRDWSSTGKNISEFGQGNSTYEKLANSLEAIGEIVDIISNIAGVVGSIAGVVAAVAGALSATVILAPVTAPVATVALQIATGASIVSGILSTINSFILQPSAMLFRALHIFKSEADPRAIENQGAELSTAAGTLGSALGSSAGSKTADVAASKTFNKPQSNNKSTNKAKKAPKKTKADTQSNKVNSAKKTSGDNLEVKYRNKTGAEIAAERGYEKPQKGYEYARKASTVDEVIIRRKRGQADKLPPLEIDTKTGKIVPKKSNKGRSGAQKKLRELSNDPNLGKADRGWLKQEINRVKRGQAKNLRNPPGKELAHKRGYEAAKGYSYKYSNLQDKSLHKLQHRTEYKYYKQKELKQSVKFTKQQTGSAGDATQSLTEADAIKIETKALQENKLSIVKQLADSEEKNYDITGPNLLMQNEKKETRVQRANPNYAAPPGTPKQIDAIQQEILQLLETRAEAEQAENKMAAEEADHQAKQAPFQEAVDETAGAITANEAHQQAVTRREQANQEQQQRQQEAQKNLGDYANRKTGMAVLTVPLFGFERFTHYASKALGKVKSISWLVPDGIENKILSWKGEMDAMNKDAREFQKALGEMDSSMSEQSAAQPARQQELQSDQSRIETVNVEAETSQQEFEQAHAGAQSIKQTNEEKIAEASAAKSEATEQRTMLDGAVAEKEQQAQTLAAQLQSWANEHKAAREAAILEAQARLQQQGYQIVEWPGQ